MYYRWLITVVVLIGVTLLCSLGYWQLSRGHQKQQLLSQWEQSGQSTTLYEHDLTEPHSQMRYAPVKLTGHFMNEHTILLDNKTNNGRPGYHVITPLALKNNKIVLIDRGWVPLERSRQILPSIPAILGEVTIEGYLDFAYRNPFIHQAIENDEITWPLRVQELDWSQMASLLNKTIFPMLVKFKYPSAYSFEIPPAKGEWLSPQRHYGYACQWFLLAFTLASLYSLFYFRHFRRGKV